MTRAEIARLGAKIAHRQPELRNRLREAIRLFKFAHPEASAWDDNKVVEEMMFALSREKNPKLTPIGRGSDGWMIFRSNIYPSRLQRAIRFVRTVLPIRWRYIGGVR